MFFLRSSTMILSALFIGILIAFFVLCVFWLCSSFAKKNTDTDGNSEKSAESENETEKPKSDAQREVEELRDELNIMQEIQELRAEIDKIKAKGKSEE